MRKKCSPYSVLISLLSLRMSWKKQNVKCFFIAYFLLPYFIYKPNPFYQKMIHSFFGKNFNFFRNLKLKS